MVKEKRKTQKRRVDWPLLRNLLAMILLLGSGFLLLYPDVKDYLTAKEARKIRESLCSAENRFSLVDDESEGEETSPKEDIPSLWEQMKRYNENLRDMSWQQEAILSSFSADLWDETKVFGTIEIPVIGLDMPLYINATDDHLAKGAALLEGTSLPVGGEGSNSVIAGHRGWKGSSYLKEIEQISVGDLIVITNPWETLYYRVIGMAVISPEDIHLLQVQEDLDLVTLLTCHPYYAPRNLRYVVCGIRVDSDEDTIMEDIYEKIPPSLLSFYTQDKECLLTEAGSAQDEIRREEIFLHLLAVLAFSLGGVLMGKTRKKLR